MNVQFDDKADTLSIQFRAVPIKKIEEVRPGYIPEFGDDNGIAAVKITGASKLVENPKSVIFTVVG